MRYFVLFMSVLVSMISIGYGLWQVQIHFDLPQWTSIIFLAATIWVAQWLAEKVDDHLFK